MHKNFSLSAWQSRLEMAETVSFDVFDTLLLRKISKPADVFDIMEKKSERAGFARRRRRAEHVARQKARDSTGTAEVTLADIYRQLDGVEQALHALELEVEGCITCANPDMQSAFHLARHAGKRVIAVSDMYLPEPWLRERLKQCGFDGIQALYVSGERGCSKADGRLFKQVLSDAGCAPGKLLHVGDNAYSDVEVPRGLGISTVWYRSIRERYEETAAVNRAVMQVLSDPEADIAAKLALGLAQVRHANSPDDSYWSRWGYQIVGPIMLSFAWWLLNRCRLDGVSEIHFMSRAGQIVQQVFDLFNSGIRSHYLWASRRMFMIADLGEVSEKSLEDFAGGDGFSTAGDYVKRLKLSSESQMLALLEKTMGVDVPINTLEKRRSLKEFFRSAIPLMREASAKERVQLLEYWTSLGLLHGDAQSRAIVDVGWRCTSQRSMETISGRRYRGYYFGFARNAYDNGIISAFLSEYEDVQDSELWIDGGVEIVELMFGGTHPTVVKLADSPSDIQPELAELTSTEKARIAVVGEIQRGVMAFARDFLALRPIAEFAPPPALATKMLKAFITQPDFQDVWHIGRMQHGMGPGATRQLPILSVFWRQQFWEGALRKAFSDVLHWPMDKWLVPLLVKSVVLALFLRATGFRALTVRLARALRARLWIG